MPHVAHLCAPAGVGGIESVVHALTAERCRTLGKTQVLALSPGPEASRFIARVAEDGVPARQIVTAPRAYRAQVLAVRQAIASGQVHLLHTHGYQADVVGRAAARAAHIPHVATFHGFTGGGLRNRVYEWLDRWTLRRADAVVCVSEANRRRLVAAGCRPDRLHVVENGIATTHARPAQREARHALGLPPDGTLVGWVGRLSREKGPDLFLDALERTDRAGLGAVFVGDGPDLATLRSRAAALTGHTITFLGTVPDAARLLSAFDLIVLSSRTEGMPMVLMESLAAGVPVAAFTVGGVPEVLTAATGWPVPPGDVPGLARAVDQALGNPADALQRADMGRRVMQDRFGLAQWAARIEAVYNSLTTPRGATCAAS